MNDADGIALLLWIFGPLLLALGFVWLCELYQGRSMRRRARKRRAFARYCASITHNGFKS